MSFSLLLVSTVAPVGFMPHADPARTTQGHSTEACEKSDSERSFHKKWSCSAATEHRVNKKHLPGNGNTAFSVLV